MSQLKWSLVAVSFFLFGCSKSFQSRLIEIPQNSKQDTSTAGGSGTTTTTTSTSTTTTAPLPPISSPTTTTTTTMTLPLPTTTTTVPAFDSSAQIPSSSDLQNGEEELIWDPQFSRGILATPACSNPDTDPGCANARQYLIQNPYGGVSGAPLWSLGQWSSRSSLPSTGAYDKYGFTYADQSKMISFGPHGEMIFGVDALAEFGGVYLNTWPGYGLIASENISAPGPGQHSSGTLDQMASLRFSIDIKLLYDNMNIRSGYDPAKHTSIFPINFTIQNLNSLSPGYGQYVWFQLMVYGDRGKATLYINGDLGTGMLIYAIPDEEFAPNGSVNSGQLVHLTADILADAKMSVQEGFNRGFLKSANLSDYYVGGANIGFEETGLNQTRIAFNNFSLKVKKLSASDLTEGFYRIGNQDAIWYVNGKGGRCVFTTWENFLRWGGKSDASNVTSIAVFPDGMTDYGACQ